MNSSRSARFIEFRDLVAIGKLPIGVGWSVPLTDIDLEKSFVIFVSHRAFILDASIDLRPSPDTPNNDKFKLIVEAVGKILPEFSPAALNCYLWLDCACVENAARPPPYESIFSVCDIVLSPMFDPEVEGSFTEETQYEAKPWSLGPQAYLNRAWCRTEMVFNTAVGLPSSSATRRSILSEHFLNLIESGRRPHLLYGSYESILKLPPLVLPENDVSFFNVYNPLSGEVSVAGDLTVIRDIITALNESIGNDQDPEEKSRIEMAIPAHIFSFLPSVPDGLNTIDFPDGSVYTGHVKDGRKHGRGIIKFITGDVYDGQFEEDLYCGLGTLMLKDSTRYEGSFLGGFYDGYGKLFYEDGDIYEGDFSVGLRHGRGLLKFADGDLYEGEFYEDSVTGYGKYTYNSGEFYEGDFLDGRYNGKGFMKYTDGSSYKGDFVNDTKQGKGLFIFANGDTYEGDFVGNKSHGQGVYKSVYGDVYKGGYKNDKRHGKGKLKTALGATVVAEWKDGLRVTHPTNCRIA